MSPATTRRLLAVHRVCGLIVGLNMLLFAVTGALLIFREQIDELTGAVPMASGGDAATSLARAVEAAREARPGQNAVYIYQDEEDLPGLVVVGMAQGSFSLDDGKAVYVEATTGKALEHVDYGDSFSGVVFRLHAQLLAGQVGSLLVGFLGLVLLTSLASGVIIYGPMMKRFAFGMLRRERKLRTLLADLHKLLGILSFGWTLVVVATGVLLSLGSLLIQYFAVTELGKLSAPYAGMPPVSDLRTLDAAAASAEQASHGRRWSFISLPGTELAGPRHYAVLLQGHQGVDKRMLTIGLVDAVDPAAVEHRVLPWYLRALLVSEPLHFGDYGGLPLKLVWLVFTLITIVMTLTGAFVSLATWRTRALRARSDVIDSNVEVGV